MPVGRRGCYSNVAAMRRVVGIDLGGAASATTGIVVLEGDKRPALASARTVKPAKAEVAERSLREEIERLEPERIAIDAPFGLPPCLQCSKKCKGPGSDSCERPDARELWKEGFNGTARRPTEAHLIKTRGVRPMPTMQLGVLTARAIALVRSLRQRGFEHDPRRPASVLEVYPAGTLAALAENGQPQLVPRSKGEDAGARARRLVAGMAELVDGLDDSSAARAVKSGGHAFDALVAAYTAWLAPEGLEPPPAELDVSAGWIWLPRRQASAPTAV